MIMILALSGCLFSSEGFEDKLDELTPTPPVPTAPATVPATPECEDEQPRREGFRDADGDGLGAGEPELLCSNLRVDNALDCDDANPDVGAMSELFIDGDGDGFGQELEFACPRPGLVSDSTDCDDTDVDVHPAADETCNSIDDDCDGQVDQGLETILWYFDSDMDGLGAGAAVESCEHDLPGHVRTSGDCNDNNPNSTEPIEVWPDQDNDGFGDSHSGSEFHCLTLDFALNSEDCDDTNPSINPGATDLGGGEDSDCDGDLAECHQVAEVRAGEAPQDVIDLLIAGGCAEANLVLEHQAAPYPGFDLPILGSVQCSTWSAGISQDDYCRIRDDGQVISATDGITLRGLKIEQGVEAQQSGGCLALSGDAGSIEDVLFDGCHGQNGGAIAIGENARNTLLQRVEIRSGSGFAGGAIHVGHGESLIANELLIQGVESQIGALYLGAGSTADVEHSTFQDNVSNMDGGGAIALSSASLIMSNSLVTGNRADEGAGLFAFESDVDLTAVDFIDNDENSATSQTARGTGVFLANSIFTGSNVGFIDNTGSVGSALLGLSNSWVTLEDGVVRGNQENSVDAPFTNYGGRTELRRVVFEDNNTLHPSGYAAMLLHSPSAGTEITDVDFVGNSGASFAAMIREGGALPILVTRMRAWNNQTYGVFDSNDVSIEIRNALMYDNQTAERPVIGMNIGHGRSLTVLNSTLADNTGRGVGYFASGAGLLRIHNSIIADNGGAAVHEAASSVGDETSDISWTTYYANGSGLHFTADEVVSEESNELHPSFDDASDPPYQLHSGSTMIDSGDPGVSDLDGSAADRGFYGGPYSP